MYYVADTDRLLTDGVLSHEQVAIIRSQSRETMMTLVMNVLLTGGIIAATLGLIFWLAAPIPVAICGGLALAGGLAALKGGTSLRVFGSAAALIGAGMLLGGAGFELVDRSAVVAGPVMIALGGAVAVGFGLMLRRPRIMGRFLIGAIFLMGVVMHFCGLAVLFEHYEITGLPLALASLYAAGALVASGVITDVRFVTALAIVPFAQMLSTGTTYWHAAYVFYSPEPTLSILQMGALIVALLFTAQRIAPRYARHAGLLAIMAMIVANFCALVGSLWGDHVGESLWGPGSYYRYSNQWESYDAFRAAREAFYETALYIPEGAYSILWAVVLVGVAVWAAAGARRGIFNAAVTFGGIHAYTQLFETFHDEPLAYVIGGLAAIPLAWGIWRWNTSLGARAVQG